MPPKTEFQKLQEEWAKKLEDSGFEDAETSGRRLKKWSSRFYSNCPHPQIWANKFEYYRMAEFFLNENSFKDEREKLIWEMHVSGKSVRAIVEILKTVSTKASYRDTVSRTIIRLRKKMNSIYMPAKGPNGQQN
jgi:hypothetical protein